MENLGSMWMMIFGYVLISVWLHFVMMMSTCSGRFGLGSSAGTEPIDEWMYEFISSEITCVFVTTHYFLLVKSSLVNQSQT